jgi:two-component system chemotaxis sensor kinase CheA
MDDMLKEFVVEARDLAANVEEHLLRLEKHPDDSDILNALFRSFHTIKGGAGFMNLPAMVSACHLTENLFDALRTGKAPVTPTAIEAALQASGFVADQLAALAGGTAPEQLAAMPSDLEDILTIAIEGKSISPKAASAAADTEVSTQQANAEPDDIVDWYALYKAVVPEGTIIETPAQQTAAAGTAPPSVKSAVGEQGNKQNLAPVKDDSIRIDSAKLDALLEVAGESVQAANQASVLLEKLMQFKFEGPAASLMTTLAETLGRASRYSTELQRATLSTRMQPVGRLFQKFPRLVRELAKDLGKEVELAIEGAETEVDRVVVDSLYDPLVHMLRNSLDHGIEPAEVRKAAGKPAKSIISLKAWQEANSVMIELSDDGKGLNAQELRQKAIKKGLIHENAAQTEEEAFQLIFLPGFSTKDVASSVSGRGVGMDVVKTAVEKHRGSISIVSTLGAGTRFTIRLPIELSIVQRVVQLPDEFQEVGGAPVMRDQGRPIPVRSLGETLGYEPETEKIGIVIAAQHPYILAVEKIEGTAEMVIKPLTAMSVVGITGTARSAEGELVLVLDLSFLMDGCRAGINAKLAA